MSAPKNPQAAEVEAALQARLAAREEKVAGLRASLSDKQRALLGKLVEGRAGAAPCGTAIPRRGAAGPAALSFVQEGLWLAERLDPDGPSSGPAAALHLTGRLDPPAFERSLSEVVRRHETLRTAFVTAGGEPRQVAVPAQPAAVPVVDLRGIPALLGEHEARRLAAAERLGPFDPGRGLLLRAVLVRRADAAWLALVRLHPLAADDPSTAILASELATLYPAFGEGAPRPPLPAPPVQYSDFAVWQCGRLAGKLLDDEVAHWRRELDGAPHLLELPADRPRAAGRAGRAGRRGAVRFSLPSPAAAALAAAEGATLLMVLAAGFQVLLGRLSGQDDLLVGAAVDGRTRPEVEPLIGPFADLLVLRGRLAGEPSCREMLARVKAAALAALGHQEVPFDRLAEELGAGAEPGGSGPLLQAAIALRQAAAETRQTPRTSGLVLHLAAEPPALPAAAARLDLALAVSEADGELACRLEYAADLFDRSTAVRLAGHLERLLAGFAEHPDRRVAELPLLTVEQLARRAAFNTTRGPLPEGLLHGPFERAAAHWPERPAVISGGAALTYGELERRANRVAHRLRRLGARPNRLVAVVMESGWEQAVAVLGVLKSGAAYLPLDPGLPVRRLAGLLADGEAEVALTQARFAGAGGLDWPAGVLPLAVDDDAPWAAEESSAPAPAQGADDLAYVIFTSGSTGRPKGVMIDHRGALNTVADVNRRFDVGPDDRVLALSSLAFDLSVYDLFGLLAAGGAVVLPDPARRRDPAHWADLAVCHRVSVWNSVPASMEMLAGHLEASGRGAGLALRLVLLSGDWIPVALPGRLAALAPGARVISLGGATEASVWSILFPVERVDPGWTSIPYGRPLTNQTCHVLDAGLEPRPDGVPGQLYIGGVGLARGYWGDAGKTAASFLVHPRTGERLYRTGDLGRFRPDGTIEFLGREDHQVKIRGFRVEPGEVEAALAGHPGVREAVVLARQDRPGDRRLVAYVVGGEGADLKGYLRERLPDYMVPAAVVALPALPLTANGKVDRGALPAPEGLAPAAGPRAGAGTPVEELLAGIWADLLAADPGRIGAASDFFELGGDSVLATRVVSRVRDLFGVELPVGRLFEAPMLGALAGAVARARGAQDRQRRLPAAPAILPVPRDAMPPLSFAQERLWFLHLLQPGSAAYNIPAALRLRGRLRVPVLAAALSALADRHEPLRTTFLARGGRPFQVIAPRGAVTWRGLPVADLRGLAAAGRELAVRAVSEREAREPFDLVAGPVLRAILLQLADDEHVLLLTLHHIAGDGWSVGVFLRELGEVYGAAAAGRWSPLSPAPPLPPLPVQYADFAVWQRRWLSGAVLDGQLAWWREQLAGVPDRLALPLDRPRQPAARRRGAALPVPLAPGLPEDLAAFSRRVGATLFMTLLAGFAALLGRLTGQPRLAVGSPVANRTRTEVEGMIGVFVNSVALAADLRGDPAFDALVVRVREMALGAYDHQDLPFERLVEELAVDRGPGQAADSPVFQVMLVVQNAPLPSCELPDLSLAVEALTAGAAKFDLTLSFSAGPGGFHGVLEYDADLFDRTTVRRWAGFLATLLAGALTQPELPLSELPLLAAGERQVLLAEAAGGPSGGAPRASFEAALLALWRAIGAGDWRAPRRAWRWRQRRRR